MDTHLKSFLRFAASEPCGAPVYINRVDRDFAQEAARQGYGRILDVPHLAHKLYPGELPKQFQINDKGRRALEDQPHD